MGRTLSMEIQAVRLLMQESPPPPPKDTTLREWFAGLVLLSPELMKDVPNDRRVVEAIRIADELLTALAEPKMPAFAPERSVEQVVPVPRPERATNPAVPKPHVRSTQRPTSPPLRQPTQRFAAVLPPPAVREVSKSTVPPNRRGLPATSSYSCLGEGGIGE